MHRNILKGVLSQSSVNPLLEYLICGYKFEDNVLDIKGTRNGTAYNLSYTDGQIKRASTYNGTNSYVEIGNVGSELEALNKFTFCCWLRQHASKDYSQVFSDYQVRTIDGTARGTGFIFTSRTNGTVNYPFIYIHPTATQYAASLSTWGYNVWTHLAISAEEGGRIKVYVNGVLKNTSPTNLASFYMSRRTGLIGNNLAGFTYWNGDLDEVYIFNKVLNESEIQLAMLGL